MSNKLNLFFLTLAHACVDAVCAMTVMQNKTIVAPMLLFWFVIGYDFLAFVTQPFVGLLIDKYRHKKEMVLLSFILLIIGLITPLHQWIRILFVGLGNSLFHVAAGADVLEKSENKMWPLGVFVSTGAIGLTIGVQYPDHFYIRLFFVSLIGLLFLAIFLTDNKEKLPFKEIQQKSAVQSINMFIPVGLLFCITIRSFMGFAKSPPFTDMVLLPLILSAFVFGGKFIGGFLCDKWGIKRVVLFSVPTACLLYFLGTDNYLIWGTAQLFINISMPITLYLLYRCMPNRPAFSFGLAAAFLTPGFLLALYKYPVPDFVFGIIFALNLILLLTADKVITRYQNKTIPVAHDSKLDTDNKKNIFKRHL